MSVILIALPACVKEDSSAKEAESKLNQILKDETEKFIVAHVSRESRDISQLFFYLFNNLQLACIRTELVQIINLW